MAPTQHARPDSRMQASPAMFPALGGLRVSDAMHAGLISCSCDTTLRTVAEMMATYRVHAVLVTARDEDELPIGRLWGVVSDSDLLRATETGDLDQQTVRGIAATPALTIRASAELARAAQLMVEHEISHLIVVESDSATPLGVISTLDIARALADVPAPRPAHQ